MTPDLMRQGTARLEAWERAHPARSGAVLQAGPDFRHGVALYVEDISVSFDGFKALNSLSLTIDVGELRCIIGPNGAGKTTMMDVITGKTRPDAGKVTFGNALLTTTEAGFADSDAVTAAVRPEDILPHAADEVGADGHVNRFPVTIADAEFLGSFWRMYLEGEAFGDRQLFANFSMNAVRRLGLEKGGRLAIEIPPERVLVFRAASA